MDSGSEANWSLDSRLERDSVNVCRLSLCQVRLMNDSNYPWLLLVPRRANATEITDLAESDRTQLMHEVSQAVDALKAETGCNKINVAAIGNVVAQLHIHIVARFHADAAWPKPVWGLVPACPYEPAALQKLVSEMRERLTVASH